MAAKPVTTACANTHLKPLLTLADTYIFNVEDGKWDVEKGTFYLIKKAAQHIKCEMAKQAHKRRTTMRIEPVQDTERQMVLSRQYKAPSIERKQ